MTHSVGRQSGAPFVSGPGATNNVTINYAGGPWTYIRTHVDSSAETLATWRLDEDTSSVIQFSNASSTNAAFVPQITTRSASTNQCVIWNAVASTDSGSSDCFYLNAKTAASGAISTRPIFGLFNNGTRVAAFSAGGVLSLGTNTTNYSRLGQKLETNTSAAYGGAALNTWDSGAGCSLFDLSRSKSSTVGTYTVVASGDELGRVTFRGADGSAFQDAAGIRGVVDGTPGANDMPGRLTFWTTPDGSATSAERMRITNAGDVGIGKTPTTGIILDVNGQLGLKSYTVATLPSASVQAGAIVYASDAGGNGPCLVISNGTNWKRCDNTSTTVS